MEFKAELADLPAMLNYIKDEAKKNKLPTQLFYKLELASEEIIVNIIHYAYPKDRSGILIDVLENQGFLEVHIKDKGLPFNPVKYVSDIGHNLPIQERKIGGLGIHLAKNLMDKIDYEYRDGMNYLILYLKMN